MERPKLGTSLLERKETRRRRARKQHLQQHEASVELGVGIHGNVRFQLRRFGSIVRAHEGGMCRWMSGVEWAE